MPPLPLLADLVQEPSDGLLLRQPGAVEMLADRQRELIFAHAVLADNPVQSVLSIEDCIAAMVIPVVILPVVVVDLHSRGGGAGWVLGGNLSSLSRD